MSWTILVTNVSQATATRVQAARAASVSAAATHAVALFFVDQRVVQGADSPSGTASSVRVTLDKVGDRWLVSGFYPV
jgi:Mce-associated membrane protein